MYKKILTISITILGLLTFLGAGCANAQTSPASSGDTGVIEVSLGQNSPKTNWGTIPMSEGKMSRTYALKNASDEPITITGMQTSCMCTVAAFDGKKFGMHSPPRITSEIAPGESKEVVVTFDPLAHGPDATGPITRQVNVFASDEDIQTTIFFSGNVVK